MLSLSFMCAFWMHHSCLSVSLNQVLIVQDALRYGLSDESLPDLYHPCHMYCPAVITRLYLQQTSASWVVCGIKALRVLLMYSSVYPRSCVQHLQGQCSSKRIRCSWSAPLPQRLAYRLYNPDCSSVWLYSWCGTHLICLAKRECFCS